MSVWAVGQESEQRTQRHKEVTGVKGRPCEILVKCPAFSGHQFTRVLRIASGSRPFPTYLKTPGL